MTPAELLESKEKQLLDKKGSIFDIQKFSIHDGPGIRTTVFLKGCPLRCPWCHNPEAMQPQPQLLFYKDKCIDCGKCFEVCPVEGALQKNSDPRINRELCTDCGICTDTCYAQALEICGKEMTVKEVLEEVEKDRPFYETSGGGMTISGGEPLNQGEFAIALLQSASEVGLHTVVDSCGLASSKAVRDAAPFTKMVLFDLKIMDGPSHREVVKADNQQIHANLRLWDSLGVDIIIRIPVIPNHTDSEENVRAASSLAAQLPRVQEVNLMRYHRLGEAKWTRLGLEYPLNGTQPPSEEAMDRLKEIVEAEGLTAIVHG